MRKQLYQPALQLRQYSAAAHPIMLDSAEINSVDKLLAKQSEGKREGSLMSDAVARESPTARCGRRNMASAVCPPSAC